jgi:hypothetical protein
MFDFFLFNHNATLRKNLGFGVSVRYINLLFCYVVGKTETFIKSNCCLAIYKTTYPFHNVI